MDIKKYSHYAYLDELTEELRHDVLRFINTGKTTPLLDQALLSDAILRKVIDYMLEEELRSYE